MDLNRIEAFLVPGRRGALPTPQDGDAWLAGGTWLFSEPQPTLRRLVDLGGLGWPPSVIGRAGLSLAATCTIAELDRLELPSAWTAAPLIGQCCRALLGSFKIWSMATVGGNLCLALPAGPMIALAVALDATAEIWTPEGGERTLPVTDFVLGPRATALSPGEVLRGLDIPAAALMRRTAFRRIALSPNGRSGALLVGTLDPEGGFALTVTASVRRPLRLAFPSLPAPRALAQAITAGIPEALYHDDVHGAPDWRRHVTFALAEEIRGELEGGGRCG